MINSYIIMGIAAVLTIALVIYAAKRGKTKKLLITTSEPDDSGNLKTIEVERKWNDSWEDVKGMKCYHVDGKRVWIATHWIIKIEEIEDGE